MHMYCDTLSCTVILSIFNAITLFGHNYVRIMRTGYVHMNKKINVINI